MRARWVWLLLAAAWHQASAQATGVLRGTVRDGTGAPVARARVQLLSTGSRALTDSSGQYRIGDVPAGAFTLQRHGPRLFHGYRAGHGSGGGFRRDRLHPATPPRLPLGDRGHGLEAP